MKHLLITITTLLLLISCKHKGNNPLYPTDNSNPVILAFTADQYTVNKGVTITFTVSADDPDGDILYYNYENVTGVGTFIGDTYTPNSNSPGGLHTIKLTAMDGLGGTAVKTMDITVNPSWYKLTETGIDTCSDNWRGYDLSIYNNILYVAYNVEGTSRLFVKYYNGTSWQSMGDNISDGSANYINIEIDNSGNIYTGFSDGVNGNCTVMKYISGSSWSVIGSKGFMSNTSGAYMNLKINSSGTLYAMAQSTIGTRGPTVRSYNGSTWPIIGTDSISASTGIYLAMTMDKSNKACVAYKEVDSAGKLSVMTYNGSWVYIDSREFTSGPINYIDIRNLNNDLYIAYSEPTFTDKVTVHKWNGSVWARIGNQAFTSTGGRPSLGYNNGYLYLMCNLRLYKYSGSWAEVGSHGFTGNHNKECLSFDSSNNPYILYANSGDYRLHVITYQ